MKSFMPYILITNAALIYFSRAGTTPGAGFNFGCVALLMFLAGTTAATNRHPSNKSSNNKA